MSLTIQFGVEPVLHAPKHVTKALRFSPDMENIRLVYERMRTRSLRVQRSRVNLLAPPIGLANLQATSHALPCCISLYTLSKKELSPSHPVYRSMNDETPRISSTRPPSIGQPSRTAGAHSTTVCSVDASVQTVLASQWPSAPHEPLQRTTHA